MKKTLFILVIGSVFLTNCVRQSETDLSAIPREFGRLEMTTSGNPFLRGGGSSYTVYLNGIIQFHGDVTFIIPGTSLEYTKNFQRTYNANYEHVQSNLYKDPQYNELQLGRLLVKILERDLIKNEVKVSAILNRITHWTDVFWGFQELRATLDVSKDIIRVTRVDILNGTTFFDRRTGVTTPDIYDREDDESQHFDPAYYQRGTTLQAIEVR